MVKKHQNADGSNAEAASETFEGSDGAEQSTGDAGLELLKKLVAKNIVGRKELNYKDPDDKDSHTPRKLYTVFGMARDIKTGESDYGPYVCFLGAFEAVRLSDGKRFSSDKLFLQDPAEGLLLAQLTAVQAEDKGATVSFAFTIGVKVSDKWQETGSGNSYEYTIDSVFQTERADPLAQLRQQIQPKMRQIQGPKP